MKNSANWPLFGIWQSAFGISPWLATASKTGKIMHMPSGRFDAMERQAADNIERILAEVEKDREELVIYSKHAPIHSGQASKVGAQQGLSNATELLNALRQLSRTLKG